MATLKNKPYEEGRVLIPMKDVREAIKFAEYSGWKLSASPLNAVFIIDRAIEKMKNVED